MNGTKQVGYSIALLFGFLSRFLFEGIRQRVIQSHLMLFNPRQ
jgi:hypothetical protein